MVFGIMCTVIAICSLRWLVIRGNLDDCDSKNEVVGKSIFCLIIGVVFTIMAFIWILLGGFDVFEQAGKYVAPLPNMLGL